MRYSAIKSCDVHNGEGLRVSLWTQGCNGYCGLKCQNRETWDKEKGKEFTEKEFNLICEQVKRGMNLSIIGGEPLEEYNIGDLTTFLKEIKYLFPNLNIWIWTHFLWEDIKQLELFKYIDVLIDGKYIDELKCDFRETNVQNDRWRGSSNQQVVDVQKSLKKGEIVLWKEN